MANYTCRQRRVINSRLAYLARSPGVYEHARFKLKFVFLEIDIEFCAFIFKKNGSH